MKTLKRYGKRMLRGILVLIMFVGGIRIVPVAAEESGYIALEENQTYKAAVYLRETGRDNAVDTEQAPAPALLKAYEKLDAAHGYIVHITGENGTLSFDAATNCFMGPTIFSDITFGNVNSALM